MRTAKNFLYFKCKKPSFSDESISSNPDEILDISRDGIILQPKKKISQFEKKISEKMPSENRNRTSVILEDRIKAVTMCQQGKSFAAIARELKRSKSCIKRNIDRYNETNSYKDRPRPGRPRISTAKDDRNLVHLV
ncbi:unnamed protein product [Brachionus calyciflorus]|uniref:Transposase IS30-like HTH domain-containing protein n=1 Tax=Brachionus calyciflorus TaxID=104777 RepID=A0A813XVP9_9BILA|nr:unnamed protein product [Brachionus calyciflorus]